MIEDIISFKHGDKWCDKCKYKTKQERYTRINQYGLISMIYRCTECNKLTTKYKKE